MTGIYGLEWPVDQAGYSFERDDGGGPLMIRARGGPLRFWRPTDSQHEALWRRFAHQCVDADGTPNLDGIMSFVTEFGLLAGKPPLQSLLDQPLRPVARRPTQAAADNIEEVPLISATALHIRNVIKLYDEGERRDAVAEFNAFSDLRLIAMIESPKGGKFEVVHVPVDLHGALLLQTLNALTGNSEWRRCRNDGCPEWFRIGTGAKTKRREFCSPRCRVANAVRRSKQKEKQR